VSPARFRLEVSTRASSSGDVIPPLPHENIGAASKKAGFNGSSDHYSDGLLAQRLKKAVGFRNIAVHSYQAIDWSIVFQISRHHLDDFKQFAQAVAKQVSAS